MREKQEMEGVRQERRRNEGGGKEAQRGQEPRRACLWTTHASEFRDRKPRKTARPAEEKWVRRRKVGVPRKSAMMRDSELSDHHLVVRLGHPHGRLCRAPRRLDPVGGQTPHRIPTPLVPGRGGHGAVRRLRPPSRATPCSGSTTRDMLLTTLAVELTSPP